MINEKLLRIVIIVLALFFIIVGYFYYNVYASEYQWDITNKVNNINSYINIRIGSYNIKLINCSKETLVNFNNDISDLELDIICLQGVDKNALCSGNYDMLEKKTKANNYSYYHFYQTMWSIDGYYGLAILSKYPIIEILLKLLPNSLFKKPWISTKINIGDEDLVVYNTHLTYENNEYRFLQMDYVKEQIDFNDCSILAGDFNIEDIKSINSDKSYMTFRNFAIPDDIYYSKHFKLINSGLKESSFSDHNLLYG